MHFQTHLYFVSQLEESNFPAPAWLMPFQDNFIFKCNLEWAKCCWDRWKEQAVRSATGNKISQSKIRKKWWVGRWISKQSYRKINLGGQEWQACKNQLQPKKVIKEDGYFSHLKARMINISPTYIPIFRSLLLGNRCSVSQTKFVKKTEKITKHYSRYQKAIAGS